MASADYSKLGKELLKEATLARFIIGGSKGLIEGKRREVVLFNDEKVRPGFEELKCVHLIRDILHRSKTIKSIFVRTGPVPGDFDGDMYVGK